MASKDPRGIESRSLLHRFQIEPSSGDVFRISILGQNGEKCLGLTGSAVDAAHFIPFDLFSVEQGVNQGSVFLEIPNFETKALPQCTRIILVRNRPNHSTVLDF